MLLISTISIPSRRSWKHGALGLSWVIVCLIATYVSMSYDFKPGRLGPRRARWPAETDDGYSPGLIRPSDTTTVLAFVHPRCVCTRATVKQLLNTLEAHPGAELIVSVFTPMNVPTQDRTTWEGSEYVKLIQAELPRAKIVVDQGGVQAWRFGALTSGTILVYDPEGNEIFRGGITDRRGGEGDNAGLQQLAKILTGEQIAQAHPTPVFGCPLVATDTPERRPEEAADVPTR